MHRVYVVAATRSPTQGARKHWHRRLRQTPVRQQSPVRQALDLYDYI